jgi:hypothetical protein
LRSQRGGRGESDHRGRNRGQEEAASH